MLLEECLVPSIGRVAWQLFLAICVVSPILCLGAIVFASTTVSNKLALTLFFAVAHYALLIVLLAAIALFFDPFKGIH